MSHFKCLTCRYNILIRKFVFEFKVSSIILGTLHIKFDYYVNKIICLLLSFFYKLYDTLKMFTL